MSANIQNIYTAEPLATGVCFVAPLGTTGPSDAVTPMATVSPDWVDLGYTGAEGFNEKNDRKTDLKRSFGGKIVKVVQSEYNASLEFTLMESLNADVLKAVFGEFNVEVTAATSEHGNQVRVVKNSILLPQQSWVIDTYDEELGDHIATTRRAPRSSPWPTSRWFTPMSSNTRLCSNASRTRASTTSSPSPTTGRLPARRTVLRPAGLDDSAPQAESQGVPECYTCRHREAA